MLTRSGILLATAAFFGAWWAAAGPTYGVEVASVLTSLKQGVWELRQRGGTGSQRLCITDRAAFIQLKHPGRACDRITLEQNKSSIIVQYTCKGSGFGRTQLRMETPQLVQLETQGVADGFPYEFSAEARWVGECSRPTG